MYVYGGISELDPVVHEPTGTNTRRSQTVSSETNYIKIMNGNELILELHANLELYWTSHMRLTCYLQMSWGKQMKR